MVGSDLDLDLSSFRDRPFGVPIEAVLYLPPPPSVNRTRKVDWRGARKYGAWIAACDISIMANGGLRGIPKMPGKFEVILVIDEHLNHLDLDNAIKAVIDYARRLELVIDDDKRHMRKVTISWGHAPSGCRLTLKSIA